MTRKLILLSIIAAYFHAAIKIFVGLAFGVNLVSLSLVLLMVGVLAKFIVRGPGVFLDLKISWFDIAMAAWFISLLFSSLITAIQLENMAGVLNCMGHAFTIPLGYFLFRLLIDYSYGSDFIGQLVENILKISVAWLVIEFAVLNIFDLSASAEAILNPVLGSTRLFDGLGASFVKAAGPIPGSQNGSIIAAMALSIFGRGLLLSRSRKNIFWIAISVLAFLTTFTLTGLIVLILVQLIFWHGKNGAGVRLLALSSVIIAGLVSAIWIEEILSLKAGVESSDGQLTEYYWNAMAGESLDSFLTAIGSNPLGIGWLQNASDPDILQIGEASGPELPKEIFLLRMIVFGGGPLIFALTLVSITVLKHYKGVWRFSPDKQVMAQSYFVVVASILISTLHYPSILAPGFSILFAAAMAQLAANNSIKPSKPNFSRSD